MSPPTLPDPYRLRTGSVNDRAGLLTFAERAYRELFPEQRDWSHLSATVDSYLTPQSPLWWIDWQDSLQPNSPEQPIALCWAGNAVDPIRGDRCSQLLLLYVDPEHRHQGLGTALMTTLETWARARGDRQLGLTVFVEHAMAQRFYQKFGFQTQSLLLTKSIES